MNILYTKSRNRLSIAKFNKLIFIYVNSRSLRNDREEKVAKEKHKDKEPELLVTPVVVDKDYPLDNDYIEE